MLLGVLAFAGVKLFKMYDKRHVRIVDPSLVEHVVKKKRPKKFSVSQVIEKVTDKATWFFTQAGMPGYKLSTLVRNTFLFILLGVMTGFIMFYLMKNMLIAFSAGLAISLVPIIEMADKLIVRRKDFKRDFPFFLQTLGFVLKNGANMNTAMIDVTDKMPDAPLKEIMKEVIINQKINGGDFIKAFNVLPRRMDIPEVKGFIDIIQNNFEKGINVADTLSEQGQFLNMLAANRKEKKVNSAENKIILPLLMALAGIALLIVDMNSFGF